MNVSHKITRVCPLCKLPDGSMMSNKRAEHERGYGLELHRDPRDCIQLLRPHIEKLETSITLGEQALSEMRGNLAEAERQADELEAKKHEKEKNDGDFDVAKDVGPAHVQDD